MWKMGKRVELAEWKTWKIESPSCSQNVLLKFEKLCSTENMIIVDKGFMVFICECPSWAVKKKERKKQTKSIQP